MTSIKKLSTLADIPNLAYEGYVWLSDANEPKVINDEAFDFGTIGINPFVIEALLYNKKENISIHVQHTGDYQIFEYHLNDFPTGNLVEKVYLPHRLAGVQKVKFKQIWLPEQDVNCEKMDVMTLKSIVFCGFIKQTIS